MARSPIGVPNVHVRQVVNYFRLQVRCNREGYGPNLILKLSRGVRWASPSVESE